MNAGTKAQQYLRKPKMENLDLFYAETSKQSTSEPRNGFHELGFGHLEAAGDGDRGMPPRGGYARRPPGVGGRIRGGGSCVSVEEKRGRRVMRGLALRADIGKKSFHDKGQNQDNVTWDIVVASYGESRTVVLIPMT
ncbi:hypothetical protein ACJRO7_016924 [Eucalyptus globulus]|uniref:Uncharacterized protein n=1 Tax=Eucalyptus globulus TaxID=34317 RepID=A0ABD3KNE0_EUCGL